MFICLNHAPIVKQKGVVILNRAHHTFWGSSPGPFVALLIEVGTASLATPLAVTAGTMHEGNKENKEVKRSNYDITVYMQCNMYALGYHSQIESYFSLLAALWRVPGEAVEQSIIL